MSEKRVQLFTSMQVWYHKHILHFMMFFIITGLPLVSDYFSWIAYLVGVPFSLGAASSLTGSDVLVTGMQICRIIHRVSAVLWLLISIPFLFTMLPKITKWGITPKLRKGQGIIDYVKEGLADNKRIYIDWQYPQTMGKYSFLQIVAAWAVIIVCILMIVSGIVLWFRQSFSIDMAAFMRVVHFTGFVIIGLFLIFHIYFAILPANRAGYKAMFGDGTDSEEHARKKHPGLFTKES